MAVSRKEVVELKGRISEHLYLLPAWDADRVKTLLDELIGLYEEEIASLMHVSDNDDVIVAPI